MAELARFPLGKGLRNSSIFQARWDSRVHARDERRHFARKKKPYGVFDSGIFGFDVWFSGLYKENSLKAYLINKFSGKSITGVELGGSGNRLFQEVNQLPGLSVKKSIGSTLVKPIEKLFSRPPFHQVIGGDLNNQSTYRHIVEALGIQKADLIISKMQAGLDNLGKDPYFFTQQLAYLYEHALSDNGVMLLQIPSYLDAFLPTWAEKAKENNLHVRYTKILDKTQIIIERNNNSPQNFPLLDANQLFGVYRSFRRK